MRFSATRSRFPPVLACSVVKGSDLIADLLVEHGIRHVFAISGAANVHILSSLSRRPELSVVCPHHEQAGVMAALGYTRLSGLTSVMVTTAGAGATNAITGVLDAWADSTPCLVISGQEHSRFTAASNPLRMWGVQGVDIARIVTPICKQARLVTHAGEIEEAVLEALELAESGRPGPVWLDIPVDVQSAQAERRPPAPRNVLHRKAPPRESLRETLSALRSAERPVVLVGNGVRLAGAQDLLAAFVEKARVPFLTAWNGADLIAADHPRHFGHEGTYGQRCANFVIQNADLVLTIGTRLAIPQLGYVLQEFARAARKIVVDVDPTELSKFGGVPGPLEGWTTVESDAKAFLGGLLGEMGETPIPEKTAWLERCAAWRTAFPLVEDGTHDHADSVNSYRFIETLSSLLGEDDVVVTDMGTALTCTHQTLRPRGGQRLLTSTGLGEMGFGLPGAIGACLASGGRRVVLLTGDGSMMMNLQELQTLVHHRLPLKMFLFANDGYLTIRHTEKAIFGEPFFCTGKADGVSCPDFVAVAAAFGIPSVRIASPGDVAEGIRRTLDAEGPILCEVAMAPNQLLAPKLSFTALPDGALVSPPLEDLSPLLPLDELRARMLVAPLPSSVRARGGQP